jgi:hypothetical protein
VEERRLGEETSFTKTAIASNKRGGFSRGVGGHAFLRRWSCATTSFHPGDVSPAQRSITTRSGNTETRTASAAAGSAVSLAAACFALRVTRCPVGEDAACGGEGAVMVHACTARLHIQMSCAELSSKRAQSIARIGEREEKRTGGRNNDADIARSLLCMKLPFHFRNAHRACEHGRACKGTRRHIHKHMHLDPTLPSVPVMRARMAKIKKEPQWPESVLSHVCFFFFALSWRCRHITHSVRSTDKNKLYKKQTTQVSRKNTSEKKRIIPHTHNVTTTTQATTAA